jgi:hypothetical protein
MADLAFADKRIQATDIGNTTLPKDVREMYKRLNALSVGEGILPTLLVSCRAWFRVTPTKIKNCRLHHQPSTKQ